MTQVNSRSLVQRLRLYLVMGSVNCRKDPLLTLEEAIRGGITAFQYREKGPGALIGHAAYELGLELRRLCRANNVLFLVNDDVELAIRLQADGIHVGQEDEAAVSVRRKMPGGILGISAHDGKEAEQALLVGADYLGVGPMYPTETKPDARKVQGPSVIREIRAQGVNLPIVGIGGIAPGRISPVIAAGANGVAVISAISSVVSPEQEARRMLEEVTTAAADEGS